MQESTMADRTMEENPSPTCSPTAVLTMENSSSGHSMPKSTELDPAVLVTHNELNKLRASLRHQAFMFTLALCFLALVALSSFGVAIAAYRKADDASSSATTSVVSSNIRVGPSNLESDAVVTGAIANGAVTSEKLRISTTVISSSTQLATNTAGAVFVSGNTTVALPNPAATVGTQITFKKTDAGTKSTIAGTIDQYTTVVLSSQNAVLSVMSDGTKWSILFAIPDSMTPRPGQGGLITLADRSSTRAEIKFFWATDDDDDVGSLQYRMYYSSSSADMMTVQGIEATGIPIGITSWSTMAQLTASEEQSDKNYAYISASLPSVGAYFLNVLVRDPHNNTAAYSYLQVTPASLIAVWAYETLLDGNIGGRTGANAKCASSSFRPLGFNGYGALISVGGNDRWKTGNVPWKDWNDGVPYFYTITGQYLAAQMVNTWTTNGFSLSSALNSSSQIAQYTASSNAKYWTGTFANGTATPDTCNGWTSNSALLSGTLGDGSSKTPLWINNGTSSCNQMLPMLCIAYWKSFA
eukprot:ANDGO_06497.mRNA.1 hypothetical protein